MTTITPKEKFDVCLIVSRSEFPAEVALYDLIKRTIPKFGFNRVTNEFIEIFLSEKDLTHLLLQRTNPMNKRVLDHRYTFGSKRFIAETYYGSDDKNMFLFYESVFGNTIYNSLRLRKIEQS